MSNENPSWGQLSQGTIWEEQPVWRSAAAATEQEADLEGTTASPILGDSVELVVPEQESKPTDNKKPLKNVGFATEPGYDDSYDAYGSRKVDHNPRHF